MGEGEKREGKLLREGRERKECKREGRKREESVKERGVCV